MAIEFASDAWLQALMDGLNNNKRFAKVGKKWEGDFYLIAPKDTDREEEACMYLDLWHGKCRSAEIVVDRSSKSPEFELIASLEIWQKIVTKQIDPIRELLSGRLKLKGPKMKILRSRKTAVELVECCSRLDTLWPE